MKSLSTRIIAGLLILALAQLACSAFGLTLSKDNNAADPQIEGGANVSQSEEQPAAQEPSAQQPASSGGVSVEAGPTPYIYKGAAPSAGTGGVFGRLLWNDLPVEGVNVKLCDEIKLIGGCEGAEYPAVTDANGVYVILNVAPGGYGLAYQALDSDSWYYVVSGVIDSRDFEVPADQMVDVGDFFTVRQDVIIISPLDDARVSETRPTISWQAYPDAAYYELTLHTDRGGSLYHRVKLTTNNFTVDRDLQNCGYSFDLEVFNARGTMIAENDGWSRFDVCDQATSCEMVSLSPADGASAPANNIVLSWEPHPWATIYKINMVVAGQSTNQVLDFVQTTSTSYTVTQTIPPGEYEWVVYGYDQYGDGVGFTDRFTLYVTSP